MRLSLKRAGVETINGGAPAAAGSPSARSRRGRRIMAAVLVMLVLLLLVATVFLLNLIRPKGQVASADKTGGVTWVRSIYGWGAAPDEQLSLPATVSFDSNGDIIVPNVGNAVRALRFDSAGVYQEMFAGSEEGFIAYPSVVEVAPDGRIYIVQGPRNEVLVLDSRGTSTERVMGIESPSAISVNEERVAIGSKAGWVIMDLEGNIILGPEGEQGSGDDQYDNVSGIVLDEDDNVYVVDTYNNRISKFDDEGNREWVVQTGRPANQVENRGGDAMAAVEATGTANLQTPSAATLDSAGRLLVVDPLDFTISAFDTDDGSFEGKWGEFGRDEGQFLYPTGIDYDPVRDWIAVADTMNNRVQVVRIPGTGGGPASAVARTLAGPIRACLIPLFILILLLVAAAIWRKRQRNRESVSASTDVAVGRKTPSEV